MEQGNKSLKPLSGNVCLRPVAAFLNDLQAELSQTPLGERVPSAGSGLSISQD